MTGRQILLTKLIADTGEVDYEKLEVMVWDWLQTEKGYALLLKDIKKQLEVNNERE